MTTGAACSLVLMAQCAVGGLFGLFDCDRDRHEYNGPDCCRACAAEQVAVVQTIAVMQRCPDWRERDDAAHALHKFDWACHPEIGPALAYTMLSDCHEEVREEAAQTLAKLAPCVPDVHVALVQAAAHDPDHATRKWARRALRNLDHRCRGECSICGPVPAEVIVATPPPAPLGPFDEVRPVPGRPPVPPPYGVYEDEGVVPYGDGGPRYGIPRPGEVIIPEPGLEGRSSMRPRFPEVPDPNARPELLPRPLPPSEVPEQPPIEVVPPELPATPPSASPFGDVPETSRRTEPIRPRARRVGPILLFTSGGNR